MTNNLDITGNELEQEFQKLAALIPTISTDQHLSQLELIEFVIAYIRQLQQQLLSDDQWNECIHTLTSSSSSSSHLFILRTSTTRRSPLTMINLENILNHLER
jgi:hypothetical protein